MADTPQSAQPNPHKKINLVSLLEQCKTQDDTQWADSTIAAHITALSPDELCSEIAEYGKDRLTPMQYLAIRGYASSISAIAKKIGADVFSLHAMQDNLILQPTTPLKYAVRQFNRNGRFTTILVFIEEMSANALNQAIQEYGRRDTDAPNQAIRLWLERKGEDSAVVAIINKLTPRSLINVLKTESFDYQSIIMFYQSIIRITNCQSPSVVQAMVNKLPTHVLESLLEILLRSLIHRGQAFRPLVQTIIEKVSTDSLQSLLEHSLQSFLECTLPFLPEYPELKKGISVLCGLAKQEDEKNFKLLINRVSSATLSLAIFMSIPSRETKVLDRLANYSNGSFLLMLCEKMQKENELAFLEKPSLFHKTYDVIIKQEDQSGILRLQRFLAILSPQALGIFLIQKPYYGN